MNAELKSEVENIRDRILAKLELPELSPDGRNNLWMIDAELCSLVNIVLAALTPEAAMLSEERIYGGARGGGKSNTLREVAEAHQHPTPPSEMGEEELRKVIGGYYASTPTHIQDDMELAKRVRDAVLATKKGENSDECYNLDSGCCDSDTGDVSRINRSLRYEKRKSQSALITKKLI